MKIRDDPAPYLPRDLAPAVATNDSCLPVVCPMGYDGEAVWYALNVTPPVAEKSDALLLGDVR